MYLDIAIAELIKADHSHDVDKKNDLLKNLKKYQHKSTILQSFLFLDEIKSENIYNSIDDFLNENSLHCFTSTIAKLTQDLKTICSNVGLNRNSVYLCDNGQITPQLPSHYKFDRSVLSLLNIKSDHLDKDSLIVPDLSNTIRIFYNIAVIKYQPTNEQITSLINMNINKFVVNDSYYDNVFDENILKLKKFRTN